MLSQPSAFAGTSFNIWDRTETNIRKSVIIKQTNKQTEKKMPMI